jgi:hypothetical protein
LSVGGPRDGQDCPSYSPKLSTDELSELVAGYSEANPAGLPPRRQPQPTVDGYNLSLVDQIPIPHSYLLPAPRLNYKSLTGVNEYRSGSMREGKNGYEENSVFGTIKQADVVGS